MNTRSLLREWLWPRDARSTAEIDAGVREELESHIERMVEERVASGLSLDEARRQAVEHFGDFDRYSAECRRIDLGDRLLVRRALTAACLVLLAACAYLGSRVLQFEDREREWHAQSIQNLEAQRRQILASVVATAAPADVAASSRESWVERITTLRDHMHTAFGVGPELTLLAPDEGLAIVREAWPQITIAEVKTGLLKAFAFSKALPSPHPRLIPVLDLGMTDNDPEIRAYAASYLKEYAHENFYDHPDRYSAWYREHREMTPETMRRSDDPTSIAPTRAELGAQ